MAISYVSGGATNGNTTAMTTHAAGDTIFATVWRNGSVTAPTVPAGWTVVRQASSTTSVLMLYYKIAASSSETTGTWTNATSVGVDVYRGVVGMAIPGTGNAGTGTTLSYLGVTLFYTDSSSWVFRCAGAKAATNIGTNTPAGFTARHALTTPTASGQRACDTNGGVSSNATGTQSVSGSGVWITISLELFGAATTPASAFFDLFNTGSTPDAAKWGTAAGSPVLTSGQLVMPTGSAIRTLTKSWSMLNSSICMQAFNWALASTWYAETIGGFGYGWRMDSGTGLVYPFFYTGNAGTGRTHTSGDWYRLRESGGTLYWDYSSDGFTWTNHYSAATPTDVGRVGFFISGSGFSGNSVFDNFNVSPTPMSALTDDFNTGSVADTTKWSYSGTANLIGGKLVLSTPVTSQGYYSIKGDAAIIQNTFGKGGSQLYVLFGYTAVGWSQPNGTNIQPVTTAGLGSTIFHNDGMWYRVREAAGTIYYDYSNDNVTWTNATSESLGSLNPYNVQYRMIGANSEFDNVNPVAPTFNGQFFAVF